MKTNKLMRRTLAVIVFSIFGLNAYAASVKINGCGLIKTPGSHILTKNIQAKGTCLVVTVPYVTIDFQGFTMEGDGSGAGIKTGNEFGSSPNWPGASISNGHITNFDIGIDLRNSESVSIEGMDIDRNIGDGVKIGNNGNVIQNRINNNGGHGISCSSSCIVDRNTIRGNIGSGIVESGESVITNNTVVQNFNSSATAAIIAGSSNIRSNSVFTSSRGIASVGNSVISGNNVTGVPRSNAIETLCPSNVYGNLVVGGGIVGFGAGCNIIDNAGP